MRSSIFRFALATCAATAVLAGAVAEAGSAGHPYKIGDQIANFQLPSDKGKQVGLSQYRGKVVVIAFYASWCPPCNQEAPSLEKDVWRALRSRGVEVLGVAAGESNKGSAKLLTGFRHKHHLTYQLLGDEHGAVYNRFGFEGIPELVVIDRTGKYRANPQGVEEAVSTIKKLLKS